MAVYVNPDTGEEHLALWQGDLSSEAEPPLVRVHVVNLLDDVLGDQASGKAGELPQVMEMLGQAGRGVLVLIRDREAMSLAQTLAKRQEEEGGKGFSELRDYGAGAQILLDLGVKDMIVLSNTKRTIVGLEGYGLRVVEQRPIPGP